MPFPSGEPSTSTTSATTNTTAAPTEPHFVFLADATINKMIVDNLKKELKLRKLSQNGRKAVLQERLKQAMVD